MTEKPFITNTPRLGEPPRRDRTNKGGSMTIEDSFLKWEGLNPEKIHEIASDLAYLLSIVKDQEKLVEDTLNQAAKVLWVIRRELPRIEKLAANIRSELTAWEAKQKELRR